jgi:hypothetical protein
MEADCVDSIDISVISMALEREVLACLHSAAALSSTMPKQRTTRKQCKCSQNLKHDIAKQHSGMSLFHSRHNALQDVSERRLEVWQLTQCADKR